MNYSRFLLMALVTLVAAPFGTLSMSAQATAKTAPVITWAKPAPVTYGTVISSTQLNATASVPGTFTYSPAAGSYTYVGTETLSVTFTPTDSATYSSVTASVPLVVNKAQPLVFWSNPAPIAHGVPLSKAQLNATAYIGGTFTYSPAAGAVLPAGTDTLSVTFVPNDTSNFTSATKTVTLTVTTAAGAGTLSVPVISWTTPSAIIYGTALSSTQLNATASVPGTFAYSPAAGTTLDVGTTTLTATFTPNDTKSYTPAVKTVPLVVTTDKVAISWSTPAAISKGTALSGAQLNATANVPGTFVYTPAAGSYPNPGTINLTAVFTPTSKNYAPATASVSLVVNKAVPVIMWSTPLQISSGVALSATQLNATAYIGGTFTYTPPAGTKLPSGTNTLSVTFQPNDTYNFVSATKTVNLVVLGGTPNAPQITWPTPAPIVAGTPLSAAQLNATASVPGTFTYSPAAGTVPATGNTTLKVTFTPANTSAYAVSTAQAVLDVLPAAKGATNIDIDGSVKVAGARRLGINLSGQTFYDSGQMLRNLTFRNPGFEGETFQTILHCSKVTATTCTDSNIYDLWPANFMKGASFQFISGNALGLTGTVTSSTAGNSAANQAVTVTFAQPAKLPAAGDFIELKMSIPGNAQAGWWTGTSGGATLSTDFNDLSPNSPGKQALSITAAGSGQSASVSSYFDSYNNRSFVQLHGTYQIAFRAKGLGGNNQVNVSLLRNQATGPEIFFNQTVSLSSAWQDYTFSFPTSETGTSIGSVQLAFKVSGANILLDDVALTPATATAGNPTAFRDEVVATLKALNPGVIRYQDANGAGLGNSIDNAIAPPFARTRAAYSTEETERDDITIGLHEVLQLCQTLGSEPWYNVPVGASATEMQNLIEYLAGDASTPYGSKRAALGQAAPWTTVFPVIHLELGNEVWNDGTFHGATMSDPAAYGKHAAILFGAARSSASYNAKSFDLIMGSWANVPWWTQQEMANSSNYDSVDAAPYLYYTLNDTSSIEAIYGPMFAEPESIDSVSTGYMYQQAQAAGASDASGVSPAKLAVYEVQLGTQSGSASQASLNAVAPSVGAGITVIDHMLLMMRDLGVTVQNLWALPEYNNQFNNTAGGSETVPLFGAIIDMGGQSNLRRPIFYAEQITNGGIMQDLLTTAVSGANPTWSQPLSTNGSVQLDAAHMIQSFAFSDGANKRSVIVINLSRTSALPVTFSGASAPFGTVTESQLTSANITDTNETAANVNYTTSSLSNFQSSTGLTVPPFSLTVLTWQASQ